MNKFIITCSFLFGILSTGAQTVATNFNCNDCAGNNHDLFTELNSNKVVILTWVMPCTTCSLAGVMAQEAKESFSVSNPGQVFHYIADDYGNSNCTSLSNWCNSNGLASRDAVFSNSIISMSDYGLDGMPKIVIVGGPSHKVYYNENNNPSFNKQNMINAISTALGEMAASVQTNELNISNLKFYPNPSQEMLELNFETQKNQELKISVYNILGKVVKTENHKTSKGNVRIKMNTQDLNDGAYFVQIESENNKVQFKIIVAH